MPASRILLVEDDAVLCDLLWRNLRARGYDVLLAHDAQVALTSLRAAPVDLMILDINLPDQTGWEVLRVAQREGWLRVQEQSSGPPKLPVVVVSAVRVSLALLKEFPLLAYLPKPFPIDALLRLAEASAHPGQEEGGEEVQSV
jgi:DNA-binding response OmpR family regulator